MRDEICCRCDSDKFSLILRIDKAASIVKCLGCDIARTYPYPDFNFKSQEKYSRFYLDNEEMFRGFAASMMGEIKGYKERGLFLDIGCAVGYLLDEAKETGFKTYGSELNGRAAEISRKKGHIIYTEPIEALRSGEEVFDVVSFNHVLEHIQEFGPFLSAVSKLLKKDGIVYCGAPNYNSFMQRLLREDWYGWGMPDHVWHFDTKTFRSVMEDGGFIAKKMVQNSMYYPYSKSFRKNTRAALARAAGLLGAGDQIYGIFGKSPA